MIQGAADTGFAKVAVHQQGLVTELRQRHREIHRCRRLSLARQRAGHQDDLWRTIRLRQKQRSSQRPKGLGDLRLRLQMRYQLDAAVAAVRLPHPLAASAGDRGHFH